MESASKVKLTRDTLEAVARKAFGEKLSEFQENHDGWFNALYELELSSGRTVFLKAAPLDSVPVLRYEKNILRTEIEVLRLLSRTPGIPVPRVLFEDRSRELVDTDYFIMERLEGISLSKARNDISEAKRAAIDVEKGRINRRLNSIQGEGFGIYGRRLVPTWSKAFLGMARDIISDGEELGAEYPIPAEELYGLFESGKAALDGVTSPRLLHWDLHDGNIIVDGSGKITGIIDCDRALWGDPAMEFYFTFMFPQGRDFFEGYGVGVADLEGFEVRRWLYDLYLATIFVTECRSRKIEDPKHLTWARGKLSEQIQARLTRA